jgi:hypothetical protein
MPGINYLDPRMMAPAYGSIIPAAAQGMGAAGDFFNMQENAQARPLRQQLSQIQLQEAQNRLAMAPLEDQLRALRLGEAQRKAAMPEFIEESVDIIGGGRELRAADPNATFENFQITEEFTPRQRVTRGQEVLTGGVVRPGERRETLASAAQVAAEAEKQAVAMESARALAQQRSRGREFESTALAELYNNAVAEGDTEAASLYKARLDRLSQAPGLLAPGTNYQRRIETMAADANLTLEAANNLVKTPEGVQALGVLATRNKIIARDPMDAMFAPKLTPQQQALVDGASRPVAPVSAVDDLFIEPVVAGTPPNFATVEEADAAAQAQGWKGPTKIIVGGRPATWRP